MEKEVAEEFDAEIEAEKRKISELYREIKGGTDDGKLNWMYKNPLEVVEREEYLLGRSVDKALDFISGKGDGGSTSKEMSNMPKRLVTDANRSRTEQIDLKKKMLEDPLIAIQQKVIDARKKLLSNPVKMKEMKAMIEAKAKQEKKAEKRRRRKIRKRQMTERVNYLLLKRLKKLSKKIDIRALVKSVQEESSEDEKKDNNWNRASTSKIGTKKNKKRSKRDSSSDSDPDESHRNKNKGGKSKSALGPKKHKKNRRNDSSESESETDDSSDEKYSKKRKKKGDTDSSESESDSENSLFDKYLERKEKNSRRPPSSSSSETDSNNEDGPSRKNKKNRQLASSGSAESSGDERGRKDKIRNRKDSDRSFHSNQNPRGYDRGRGGRGQKTREHGRLRAQKFRENQRGRGWGRGRGGRGNRGRGGFRGNRGSPRGGNRRESFRNYEEKKRSRSPGSDEDERGGGERRYKPSRNWRSPDRNADGIEGEKLPKQYRSKRNRSPAGERGRESPNQSAGKKYGLSTIDGSRPDLSPKEYIQEFSTYKKKEEKTKYVPPKPVQLTDEEREAQLKAMMDNAKLRKKEQETNSVLQRNQKEKEDKVQDYDKDFVRKQVASLTAYGSVADRIKANVNNIQRASSSMSQNFVRK